MKDKFYEILINVFQIVYITGYAYEFLLLILLALDKFRPIGIDFHIPIIIGLVWGIYILFMAFYNRGVEYIWKRKLKVK